MVTLVAFLCWEKVVILSRMVPFHERILHVSRIKGWFEWVEFVVVVMMMLPGVKVSFQVRVLFVFLRLVMAGILATLVG